MTRRVIEHKSCTKDNENLTVICIFEEAVSKQDIKKMNPYTKTYQTLIFNQYTQTYEYKMGKG